MTQRRDVRPDVTDAYEADDLTALAEIYDRWSPLVYSIALRALGDVTEAEEITQRVFTQVWTAQHAPDATKVQVPAGLLEMARDHIAAAQAAASDQAHYRTPIGSATQVEDKLPPADLAERLELADEMSRLDELSQQVLHLALHEDLNHVEIAERLGLSPSAVKSHIGRGLVELRKRMDVQSDAY